MGWPFQWLRLLWMSISYARDTETSGNPHTTFMIEKKNPKTLLSGHLKVRFNQRCKLVSLANWIERGKNSILKKWFVRQFMCMCGRSCDWIMVILWHHQNCTVFQGTDCRSSMVCLLSIVVAARQVILPIIDIQGLSVIELIVIQTFSPNVPHQLINEC